MVGKFIICFVLLFAHYSAGREFNDNHAIRQIRSSRRSSANTLLDKNRSFATFDRNSDHKLTLAEFKRICSALFKNDHGTAYSVSNHKLQQIFNVFDKNNDHFIDRHEYKFCWNNWIKTIMHPKSALLVVDVQNDFLNGSLSITNGDEIIEPINRLLNSIKFDGVFYSLDWHPRNHISFIDNVRTRPIHPTSRISAESAKVFDTVIFDGPSHVPREQRLWPKHCVQNSWGAKLHEDLKVLKKSKIVHKGTNPEIDSNSMFYDNQRLSQTTLDAQLKELGITDLYVTGLAYDVCVAMTVADAISLGYRTTLVDDCCRGVSLKDIEKTKETIIASNGVIVSSNEVGAMVAAKDRRPELGFKLAMDLGKSNL